MPGMRRRLDGMDVLVLRVVPVDLQKLLLVLYSYSTSDYCTAVLQYLYVIMAFAQRYLGGLTARLVNLRRVQQRFPFSSSASGSKTKFKAKAGESTTGSGGGASSAGGEAKKSWWVSAEFWGAAGAAAGWGMTGAAIYDASMAGPEIISLNMTSVMIVYSSLFARWAWVVKPRNLALCACHVSNIVAQTNQMRRAIVHKLDSGEEEQVKEIGMKAAAFGATVGGLVVAGPTIQSAVVGANLGPISTGAAAAAGPFTVHFWAPMSKWCVLYDQ